MERKDRVIRLLAVVCVATGLAACGADGEPVQPTMNATVGLGSGGANAYGSVGLRKGPVSINLGF